MPKSVPEIASGPDPVGPYSVATEANGFVFLSGQVALDSKTGDRVDDTVGTVLETGDTQTTTTPPAPTADTGRPTLPDTADTADDV